MEVVNIQEEREVYTIPPNFIDTGTVMGGVVKLRNAIEALVFGGALTYIIFNLKFSIDTKIIMVCVIVLPVIMLCLIGFNRESLLSFIINFIIFLKNRRSLGVNCDNNKNRLLGVKKDNKKIKLVKSINPISNYLPLNKVQNGVIYTDDGRYIKIVEILPINFLLRNTKEQNNIIYSFISFLKIAPMKAQFKILSKKSDISKHLNKVKLQIENETDENCIKLQKDYENLIKNLSSREGITRRFFLIFEYETLYNVKKGNEEIEALSELETMTNTIKSYLANCGNELIVGEDDFAIEIFYSLLNREKSISTNLLEQMNYIKNQYELKGWDNEINSINVCEFISPTKINFSKSNYVQIDDTYYSYMMIPSNGYKTLVPAGWTSLLINAGEGIDVDIFMKKYEKDKIKQKLGQQIRINRSKIKDTQDTNVDFDDLENAISSGYYLKNGLANNEDFYYMNILITITANSVDELNFRIREMKKLLISNDFEVALCNFRLEQAFLSTLPLNKLNKKLFEMSKRNVLTSSLASTYPFTSFELSDENGIMLGVNKHNNSLIITDIFNSKKYKNANIAIVGTSGAGKTFLMQLMALRFRRRNIQTFIIAPLKGHEFYKACKNINGEFIQISPSSQNCINIMEIRKSDVISGDILDEYVIEKSYLASKIQRLHIFFSLLIPDLTHEEKQLLDDSLIKTYEEKGITHNNESLISKLNPNNYKEMPVLADLHKILNKSENTKRIANILSRLVTGSARTFSQTTNVNLNNKYTVLDISELTGDLLTVGMFVALDFVWDKAKEDRTKEKAIFIDETWQLIGASSNSLAAEFVLEVFKIIRGYGGSAICGTQDLHDFFALEDGKYGKGIINNSKTKVILNLEDDEAERVQKILKLSETEKLEITRFERGEGLISTNNNNVTAIFKASDLEKELITSDREELKQLARRNNNIN